MQLVFTGRSKFNFSNAVFYELIYSLTGYYNSKLDRLRQHLQGTQRMIDLSEAGFIDEDFKIYERSKQFKKSLIKIEKDSTTAASFFKTLQ